VSKSIQAIRGMNDILPVETPRWQYVESVFRELMAAYGYSEIRLPSVEKTELFSAPSAKSPTSSRRKCTPLRIATGIA